MNSIQPSEEMISEMKQAAGNRLESEMEPVSDAARQSSEPVTRHRSLDVLHWLMNVPLMPRAIRERKARELSFYKQGDDPKGPGRKKPFDDVHRFMLANLSQGRLFLPMEDCPDFDYTAGCRGHRPDRPKMDRATAEMLLEKLQKMQSELEQQDEQGASERARTDLQEPVDDVPDDLTGVSA